MHRSPRGARIKLRLLTVALLAATPLAAQALGLGRLAVDSGLDEPLVGQIELISPTAQELKTLKASLASREDFDIAGIERAPHLFDLKYALTQKSDGRHYLKVTTDQPVREPFLHFLVQVEWSGGRLIREYTALLDPPQWVAGAPTDIDVPAAAVTEPLPEPAAGPEAPAAAAPAAAATPAETASAEAAEAERTQLGMTETPPDAAAAAPADAQAPSVAAPTPTTEPAPTAEAPSVAEAPPAPATTEVGPLAAAPPAPAEQWIPPAETTAAEPAPAPIPPGVTPTAFEYGPVKTGETLSQIADRVNVDRAFTSQQVMIALLRANPQAFYDNNVNILRTGKILKVPDRDQVSAIPRAEAVREFQAQYDAWQEYKLKMAGASRMVAVTAEEPKAAAEPAPKATAAKAKPEKSAKVTKGAKGAAKAEPVDLLRIVRANLEQEIADDTTKTPGVETKGEATREQRALGDRVATLEEAIESKQMQNKDLRDRVGKLQEQVKNTERLVELENKELALAQKQAAEKQAADAKAAAEKAAAERAAAEKAAAEKLAADKLAADKAAAEAAAAAAAKAAQEKAQAAAAKPVEAAKPATPAQPPAAAARKPAPAPQPVPEPSFVESLLASVLDNQLALTMLAGVGVLAAGVGGLYAYRRRRASREFSESILTGTSLTSESSLSDTGTPSAASDTSFLSDFSQGGMGNIHTDEVDPIAEAEVYLAYGRDEQAEEILKDAIVKDPARQELKGKLLEIYFQRNDVGGFETLAEELYAQLEGKGGKVWDKVEDMGRKLSPSNPMFRGGKPAAAPAAATTTLMGASAAGAGATTLLATEREPALATETLDFGAAVAPESAPPAASGGLDFNLNFDTGSAPAAPASGLDMAFDLDARSPEPSAGAGGLDLDLGFGEPATTADTSSGMIDFSASSAAAPSGGIDFTAELSSPAGGESIEFTPGGGAIAFETPSAEGAEAAALPGWDETATKLDLAKAYIDMGDSEGARSILDEVLAEGNDQQKQQARELAAQIAA